MRLGVDVGDPDERLEWTHDWDEEALLAALHSELIREACFSEEDRRSGMPRALTIDEVGAIVEREEQLASWGESLGDTLRFVVADAEMRSIPLEDALDARIAAYLDYYELAQRYVRSVLRVDVDGSDRPATEVARDDGRNLAILTAANPMGVELPESENARRNDAMAAMLDDPLRATGSSPEGDWVEHGFAVTFSEKALEVAQRFAQAAVFIVDPGSVGVVQLVGCDHGELRDQYSAWMVDRHGR